MRADAKTYAWMYGRISQAVRGKEVLEIATGPGLLAKHVATAAKRILAIDCAEGMVREAKKAIARQIGHSKSPMQRNSHAKTPLSAL